MAEAKKSKRVLEIETMKAIAIIAMVFVHVFEVSMDGLELSSKLPYALAQMIEFFGTVPSAVAFMFAMGFGTAFSKSLPKASVRRIVKLCVLGLWVNFVQFWVPCIMDPGNFGALSDSLFKIIAVDIYAFAMLSTVYATVIFLIPKIKTVRDGLMVSAIVIAIAFAVNIIFGFETFTTGNNWADTLIGLFIRENEWSYFPFISWIVFPLTGFGAGYYYIKLNDHKKYVRLMLFTGIALLAIGVCLMQILGMDKKVLFLPYGTNYGLYYSMHPVYAVTALGMISAEFALVSLILKFTNNTIPSFMTEMSRNVMDIYVLQWMFVGCASILLVRLSSIYVNMMIAVVFIVTAFFVSRALESRKRKRKTESGNGVGSKDN